MAANTIEGKDLMLFIGTTTKKAIALATSMKLSISHASKEISSKDSGIWTDLAKGRLKWDASSDCLVTYDTTANNFEAMYDAMIARNKVTLTFALATGTSPDWTVDTTKDIYVGEAFIDKLDMNANDGDQTSFTVSFSGTGALTKTSGV